MKLDQEDIDAIVNAAMKRAGKELHKMFWIVGIAWLFFKYIWSVLW